MEVTSIVISELQPKEAGVCADVSIVLDDAIRINHIKVKNGACGLYITFPSYRSDKDVRFVNGKRKFVDLVHPVKTEVREQIKAVVLKEYSKLING